VSHTTLHRWVIRLVLQYEGRWNRRAKPASSSWRVDETHIKSGPKCFTNAALVGLRLSSDEPVLEQHLGVTTPGDQTALSIDAGLQFTPDCNRDPLWYRTGASNPEAAIQVRARQPGFLVTLPAAGPGSGGPGTVSCVAIPLAGFRQYTRNGALGVPSKLSEISALGGLAALSRHWAGGRRGTAMVSSIRWSPLSQSGPACRLHISFAKMPASSGS